MWAIVPSAGVESSTEPLALGGEGEDARARSVSDLLVDRLVLAGATRVCFVIGPEQWDVVLHHGAEASGRPVAYVVQPRPAGLCDAMFRALPLLRPEDPVVVGRPDAVWFPERALGRLGDGGLSLLCFPVAHPERFEAVLGGDDGEVREVLVQRRGQVSPWIWGALRLDGATLRALHDLWCERGREDRRFGTLVNAWIAHGGTARAVRAGEVYVDTTTAAGRAEAAALLEGHARPRAA